MQENMFTSWFNKRHVSDSVLSEFKVHWGVSQIMGECIVIPVADKEGNFSFNKYRRNPMIDAKPKYLYDKGAHIELYGWWKARQYDKILITEGELDSLVAWSNNIPAVSSTGGALSFQEDWSQLLSTKDVTICFDNDSAGGQGMARALRYIPHAYVMFIPDRQGVKDLTDYVANGGSIHELLKTRIHFNNLEEVIDDKIKRIATYQSTWFHDAMIELHSTPVYVNADRPIDKKASDDITIAKNVPISQLLKFNRVGKTKCIWHADSDPSLHFYNKTNTVYCFSCGYHGDAIDVYRQINNCSFKDAVKVLKNL